MWNIVNISPLSPFKENQGAFENVDEKISHCVMVKYLQDPSSQEFAYSKLAQLVTVNNSNIFLCICAGENKWNTSGIWSILH